MTEAQNREKMLDMMDGQLVTASQIAADLGVSERTVYRYVGRLRNAGNQIISGSGAGYMLRRRASTRQERGQ